MLQANNHRSHHLFPSVNIVNNRIPMRLAIYVGNTRLLNPFLHYNLSPCKGVGFPF